ncbi:MAG: hypothetical protein D6746_05175 [Bacteroidetes bacterium]|nr:MAG: hypothetical protein D6746_05175 [Bacteroidota bacterium]
MKKVTIEVSTKGAVILGALAGINSTWANAISLAWDVVALVAVAMLSICILYAINKRVDYIMDQLSETGEASNFDVDMLHVGAIFGTFLDYLLITIALIVALKLLDIDIAQDSYTITAIIVIIAMIRPKPQFTILKISDQ